MKKQSNLTHVNGHTVFVYTIVGLLGLAAILYPTESNQASTLVGADQSTKYSNELSPNLYVFDTAYGHAAGEEFIVEVRTDSQETQVNAVNASLGYSQDSLEFMAVEASESAFAIEAQTSVENGVITIARGHIGGVQGDQLVARLRFKALTQVESSAIQPIMPQSSLLSHIDSSNIL